VFLKDIKYKISISEKDFGDNFAAQGLSYAMKRQGGSMTLRPRRQNRWYNVGYGSVGYGLTAASAY